MNFKILVLIFYYLLFVSSSIQKQIRILKEENGTEEGKTCEKEEEKEKEMDFSKISSSKIKKENMPHSQVLLPIRRIGTSNMKIGEGPCGGIEKKKANTLTNKSSLINVIWQILVPENTGNCTVKISNGLQNNDNFVLLKPLNEEINEDGSFSCGREKGFENKEFILPDDYECDGCTLQWKWMTSYGDFYSCSDIIINGGSLNKCMGKCLNGGSCFNGKCLCIKGFYGEFCEDYSKSSSKTWLWIFIGIILLVGLFYLIYKVFPDIMNKCKKGWTNSNQENIQPPFPENSSHRMEPDVINN
jgi:hypothetical protein